AGNAAPDARRAEDVVVRFTSSPKELDRFGLRSYNSPRSSLRHRAIRGIFGRRLILSGDSGMGERTHTTTGNANSSKKKWALIITGPAVLILTAGVMLQITRPTSAFPEDGSRSSGSASQAGKSAAGDQGPRKAKPVAVVGKEFITYDELAAECVARNGKDILENLINRKIIQQAC